MEEMFGILHASVSTGPDLLASSEHNQIMTKASTLAQKTSSQQDAIARSEEGDTCLQEQKIVVHW